MRTIDQFNFCNKKVIIRVDFNVPIERWRVVGTWFETRGGHPSEGRHLRESVILLFTLEHHQWPGHGGGCIIISGPNNLTLDLPWRSKKRGGGRGV